MYSAAESTSRIRFADATTSPAVGAAGAAPDVSGASGILGDVVERNSARVSAAAAPAIAAGSAASMVGGFPAVFHRGDFSRKPSAFSARLSAARDARAAAVTSVSEQEAVGAAAPVPAAAEPVDVAARLALAEVLGFSTVGELDAFEAEADTRARAMNPDEVREALSDARAAVGDRVFNEYASRMESRRHFSGRGSVSGGGVVDGGARNAAISGMSARAGAVDFSKILTEADLDAAVRAFLPPSELAKLEWTGVTRVLPTPREPTSSHSRNAADDSGNSDANEEDGSGRPGAMAEDLLSASTLRVPRVAFAGSAQALGLLSTVADAESGGRAPLALTTDTTVSSLAELTAAVTGPSTTPVRPGDTALAVDPSLVDLRFDLDGVLVRGSSGNGSGALGDDENDAVLAGLTHHGDAQARAGYTVSDFLGLARSSVEGQRTLALRALGGLLSRRRAAFRSGKTAPPRTSSTATWCSDWVSEEAPALRALVLPPLLPLFLRLGADETASAPLTAALSAIVAFTVADDAADSEKNDGGGVESSASGVRGALGGVDVVCGWALVHPPARRAQPPAASELDAADVCDGVSRSGDDDGDTNGARGTRTAAVALREGASALRDPLFVFFNKWDVADRLGEILCAWYSTQAAPALGVARAALRILTAAAAAGHVKAHMSVTMPLRAGTVGGRPTRAPLAVWIAHTFVFETFAALRVKGDAVGAEAVATALDALRFIRALAGTDASFARAMCDVGGVGFGSLSGDEAGGVLRAGLPALTISALFCALPLDGPSARMLAQGSEWWQGNERFDSDVVSGGRSGAPVTTLSATLHLEAGLETLRILRTCVALGAGLECATALLPTLIARWVPPQLILGVQASRVPPVAARAAATFAAAVIDVTAGLAAYAALAGAAVVERSDLSHSSDVVSDTVADAGALGHQVISLAASVLPTSENALVWARVVAHGDSAAWSSRALVVASQLALYAALFTPSASLVAPTSVAVPRAYRHPESISSDEDDGALAPAFVLDATPARAMAAGKFLLSHILEPLARSGLVHFALCEATRERPCAISGALIGAYIRAVRAASARAPAAELPTILSDVDGRLTFAEWASMVPLKMVTAGEDAAADGERVEGDAWDAVYSESVASSRSPLCAPSRARAARPFAHAAYAGLAAAAMPRNSDRAATSNVVVRLLELFGPGDEALAADLLSRLLDPSSLSSATEGSIARTLSVRARLLPLLVSAVCGDGDAARSTFRVSNSSRLLRLSAPGLLGGRASSGAIATQLPSDVAPRVPRAMLLGKASGDVAGVIARLPRPLRTPLGLTGASAASPAAPALTLLAAPLTLALALGGAYDGLLGERAVAALRGLRKQFGADFNRAGRGGGSQAEGEAVASRDAGDDAEEADGEDAVREEDAAAASQAASELIDALLIFAASCGGVGSICWRGTSPSARAAALSSTLLVFFLLLHSPLLPDTGDFGDASARAAAILSSHTAALDAASLLSASPAALPVFSPATFLALHARVGARPLRALSAALATVLESDGPTAAAGATASSLLALSARSVGFPPSARAPYSAQAITRGAALAEALAPLLSADDASGGGSSAATSPAVAAAAAFAGTGVAHAVSLPASVDATALADFLVPCAEFETRAEVNARAAAALAVLCAPATNAAVSGDRLRLVRGLVRSRNLARFTLLRGDSALARARAEVVHAAMADGSALVLEDSWEGGDGGGQTAEVEGGGESAYALAVARVSASLWGRRGDGTSMGFSAREALRELVSAADPAVLAHVIAVDT